MENASKALQMAAGVMLALMIAALVIWGFKQMGKLPEQEDENLSTEQLQKFNQEFEVYDKSLMYGVDVISCMNKVQNYNNKYVLTNDPNSGKQLKGTGFFSGTSEAGKEYKINIYLSLTKPLEESLEFYRIDPKNGREVPVLSIDTDDLYKYNNIKLKNLFGEGCFGSGRTYTTYEDGLDVSTLINGGRLIAYLNDSDNKNYMLGREDNKLAGGNECPDLKDDDKYKYGYYSLIKIKDSDAAATGGSDTKISNLLKLSNELTKTVKNNGKWYDSNSTPTNPSKIDYDVLSKVIWKNAVYDLKKRQFTCQKIEYSEKTGQVNAIYFAEVWYQVATQIK